MYFESKEKAAKSINVFMICLTWFAVVGTSGSAWALLSGITGGYKWIEVLAVVLMYAPATIVFFVFAFGMIKFWDELFEMCMTTMVWYPEKDNSEE